MLNLIFGFFSVQSVPDGYSGSSVWVSAGWIVALLLAAGLLSVEGLIAKGKKAPTYLVTVLSLVGGVGALLVLISAPSGAKAGIGLILVLIFGLVQAGAAIYWWLTDSKTVGGVPGAAGPAAPGGPAFGAALAAPAAPAAPEPPAFGGGFPPAPEQQFGGYQSGGNAPTTTGGNSAYGGYVPGGDTGSGPAAPQYGGYGADQQGYGQQLYGAPTSGASPAAAPYQGASDPGAPSLTKPDEATSYVPRGGDVAGYHPGGNQGPDDGPSPEVTQQVRF